MWILILTVLIIISATLTIFAEYHGPRKIVYLFKPLTTCLIILLALVPKYPVAPFYRYMIVAGLMCSLAGDLFLMWPEERFVEGLLSFLVAHLCYIVAFTFAVGSASHVLSAIVLIILLAYRLLPLWHKVGKMKWPVMIYSTVILLMMWAAWLAYLKTGQTGSLLTAGGASLFVASDFLLAANRFRRRFRTAQLLILITYFTAQWLIALSS